MPESHGVIDIGEGVQRFFQDEQVDDWKCPSCAVVGIGYRSSSCITLPDLLIVQVKRFNWRNGSLVKLNNDIRCPLKELSLNAAKFDLVAAINHHGSVNSGHYSAYINNKDRWYGCDDNKTFLLANNEVITPAAYLLVFRKSAGD